MGKEKGEEEKRRSQG